MPRLTIRAEAPEDHRRIADVTTKAFGKEREARMVDAFLAIPLTTYDPTLRGRVLFPPAFRET